jgi:hypothetical protein
MKSRGINNSKKEFEFDISADGIKIIPLDDLLLNGNGSLNNSQKNLKKKFE